MTLFLLECKTPNQEKPFWLTDQDGYTFNQKFALKFQTEESAIRHRDESEARKYYVPKKYEFEE